MTNHDERRARFEAYLNRSDLCRGGQAPAYWSTDGAAFFRVEGAGPEICIERIDLASGVVTSLLDVDSVRAAVARQTGRALARPGLPFDSVLAVSDQAVRFTLEGRAFSVDPRTSDVRALLSGPQPQTWLRGSYLVEFEAPEIRSPDGRWFAGVHGGDITVRSAEDGRTLPVTADASSDVTWDIETPRARLLPGLVVSEHLVSPWRPDSTSLFATRRDVSGVFRMPRIYWLKAFEEVDFTPFQKAGARMDRHQPQIVDIRRGLAIPLDIGEIEDRFVQLLGWRPDGREVLMIVYSRDFKRLEIFAADGETGAVRPVMAETAETFVKLQHDSVMANAHGFTFLPDSSGFLWLSTRDGFNHLYHYDISGRLVRQLTQGAWPVHDIVHAGADGEVTFTAAIDEARPYDVHVCRVALADGVVRRLTDEPGSHAPSVAPVGGAFLDTHSRYDRPTRVDLRRADGSLVRTVSEMDVSLLEAAGYTAPEEFVVKAADGETDLWGVLYKPADFDPAQTYPVIHHIYGGPQVATTARHFAVSPSRSRNLPWALAQLGYIVVTLDARGTPGRSKAFQDVVYGAWGVNEIPDHAAAMRQLLERHAWMDGDRVGIAGHSWGGYFSTRALMQAPDLYKAAVSSSPGYDPYGGFLYEPYLDLPSRNRAAYDFADLTQHAAELQGDLLILSGTSEHGVVTDAIRMSRALIDAGIQHEYALLPGEYHTYTGRGETYFINKLAAWFERHLMNRKKVP